MQHIGEIVADILKDSQCNGRLWVYVPNWGNQKKYYFISHSKDNIIKIIYDKKNKKNFSTLDKMMHDIVEFKDFDVKINGIVDALRFIPGITYDVNIGEKLRRIKKFAKEAEWQKFNNTFSIYAENKEIVTMIFNMFMDQLNIKELHVE